MQRVLESFRAHGSAAVGNKPRLTVEPRSEAARFLLSEAFHLADHRGSSQGLLVRKAENGSFGYQPASAALHELATAVLVAYREDPTALIRCVTAEALSRVRARLHELAERLLEEPAAEAVPTNPPPASVLPSRGDNPERRGAGKHPTD